MAINNPVIDLMEPGDFNVMLTVFNNTNKSSTKKTKEVYNEWLELVKKSLGDCIFRNPFGVVRLYTSKESTGQIGVRSTQEVIAIIQSAFEIPETFRIDILYPEGGSQSWIIALAKDLV